MPSIDRRSLQHFDWILLVLVAVLVSIGIGNLYSATASGVESGLPPEFRRQLLALGVAAVVGVVALVLDYRRLERLAVPVFVVAMVLLASTLVFAPVTRGNRSWLIWGSLSLQPAEIAKLALIVALARWFTQNPPGELRRIRDLFQPALIAAIPVGIIVLQRDLGVAVLTLLTAGTYLFLVRIPWRAWAGIGGVAIAGFAVLWTFFLQEYQQKRILDFVDPSRDPLASGYQAMQSKIAIGSGGFVGKGYLEGTQTQLRFLPTQHTD
ncbi:MAG: FtsW/RodA/SpoVE family cell cycle protein, partial [Myxococcota bacterium]